VNGISLGLLKHETPTLAIVEAFEGTNVRIEALYGGAWHRACESVVECPTP
jgi:hypothetical protein